MADFRLLNVRADKYAVIDDELPAPVIQSAAVVKPAPVAPVVGDLNERVGALSPDSLAAMSLVVEAIGVTLKPYDAKIRKLEEQFQRSQSVEKRQMDGYLLDVEMRNGLIESEQRTNARLQRELDESHAVVRTIMRALPDARAMVFSKFGADFVARMDQSK